MPINSSLQGIVQELQERARGWRASILNTPPANACGLAFCHRIADDLDAIIRDIYKLARIQALEQSSEHYQPGRTEVAIIATGGYGRRELCPFSDVDIAFIPSEQDNPFVDTLVKRAFRLLVEVIMDATDLRVGYAYRPIEEVPHLDHVTKTALLDARLIAGDESLLSRSRTALHGSIDPVSFLREKTAEREAMRAKTHT
ncbi:MAG TPA: hypothetical protein EYP10_08990 [Armatimonadetes bacterium]|nr:hypothetical protein [Armatimonadota bacterium]